MSFPVIIDSITPKDTDSVSQGASQIRAIKSALVDILGIQDNIPIQSSLAGYDTNKNAFVMSPVLVNTSIAIEGRLRYNGIEPEFYNGSQWIGLVTGTATLTISNKSIYKMQVATW